MYENEDEKYKRLSENETKEYPRQSKNLSANSDEVKELNKNPNNNGYKILKYNEDTGICIIRDKYLNYGLSDKDFNIILPTEYMNISFCKDGDTNILLQKKDENGTPKYGITNKEGKVIIEPIYTSIRSSKKFPNNYELCDGDTFNIDSQELLLADINTGRLICIIQQEKLEEYIENEPEKFCEFDYKAFASDLSRQSKKLIPEEIKGEDRTYIIEKIEEYSIKIGEKLVNTDEYQYTEKQKEFIIQVVAEWVFHKTIDLVHAGITKENREFIISHVAYIVFEVLKDGLSENADRQEILNEVENQVNKMYKSCLNDLYSNSDITLETYNHAIKYSNIDDIANEENENHGSFYSTDEKSDSNYLKDKMLYMYGKELAYKYLVKAAHVLKKHNCNKKDRQKIVKYLYGCSEYYIDSALHVEFEFKKPEMERLLTVGMEVAFHRIVVMYKNNILNNSTMAEDIIDTFASIVCAVELNYIKDKDKLKDEYYIANTIYFRELKEHLKEWLDEGKITKEQYNHALDKSGLVYLTPELTRLMKAKGFHIGRIGYMTIFIVVWVIFKLIIFYTKHH